jgi:hemoglobin-like flavoprotein
MTPDQKQLVQRTFAMVLPIAATAADLFYDRLFALDPALRRLFAADLGPQKKALMAMLQVAVAGLEQPATLLPAVRQLGIRHAAYGVGDRDYETVGAALLWTLERGLGDQFTPEVAAAWMAVYELLATTMREAAHEQAAMPVA